MKLVDSHGRKINYLRLSVTDRCNLRCTYCMPAEGVEKITHHDVLSYEELFAVAEASVALGIEKIRVTGGEPLVRKGIIPFLARLANLPGLRQLVLTTNGVLLPEMAQGLKDAGVQRLNISLDSLKPERFREITRCGDVNRVLDGINAATSAGLPVKLNMVVMRGVNDDEILDLAALTIAKRITVRFIEYMPTSVAPGWQEQVVTGQEILERIAAEYPLHAVDRGELAGPSRDFAIDGAEGTLGIITAISGHFCNDCNRVRVTSSGLLRTCLFNEHGYDLKPVLRGDHPEKLEETLRQVIFDKPREHGMNCNETGHESFDMSRIGG